MAFSVGKIKERNHTCTYENITFDGICTMKQAKVLTAKELNKVCEVISLYAHAERNRAMVLLTHLCGLRVCELANLRVSDVMNENGKIRDLLYKALKKFKGNSKYVEYMKSQQSNQLGQPNFHHLCTVSCPHAKHEWMFAYDVPHLVSDASVITQSKLLLAKYGY